MAQSLNTKVDISMEATSYMGIASYGKVMVGDRAFEFYNERNVEDYIQIPWAEVDYIAASVLFGKWINRFAIFTKRNGHYSFSARDNKALLRAVRTYVDSEHLVKSDTFFKVIKRGIKSLFKKKH